MRPWALRIGFGGWLMAGAVSAALAGDPPPSQSTVAYNPPRNRWLQPVPPSSPCPPGVYPVIPSPLVDLPSTQPLPSPQPRELPVTPPSERLGERPTTPPTDRPGERPGTPPGTPPDLSQPPSNDFGNLATPTEAGAQPLMAYEPGMMGDLIGVFGVRCLCDEQSGEIRLVDVPLGTRYTGVKVIDNESPRPTDRAFFTFNHYNNVGPNQLPAGEPQIDFMRQIVGFEKTFWNGQASVGMRLPFIQLQGSEFIEQREVADITTILKFALYDDRSTGSILSGGLAITVPTGGASPALADGTTAPRSWLFQPWLGGILSYQDWYAQGFTSLVLPSNERDVILLFNSVGASYYLYRDDTDRFLQAILPTVELHINTPLDQRSPEDGAIFFRDQFNLTFGSHFVFQRASVGVAVCFPLAGPRPYEVESLLTMNFRF